MPIYAIDNPYRISAFLAQIGHESGGLVYTAEIWGPTTQQLKYEPPSQLANKLGNALPGDGKLFKGRGLIQITGRHNYTQLSRALSVDLISNPKQLETCDIAVRSACWFWQNRSLNELSDLNTEESYRKITLTINGGLNGWNDRLKRWDDAKKLFIQSANNT